MNNYIVSARKYRPSTFRSVVGQKSLTTTLKNAISTNKLAHAYLFCGPRGVGKTTCARIFAKTINCLSLTPEGEACNQCESCVSFNEHRSYNIHELDAASNNSVDDIRSLVEQVRIPPQIGQYKVYIIDEVHMLSTGAFNAFLKTLEEPPKHAIFILATTEKHKILATILSRCQTYDFKRIGVKDTVEHLQYVATQENVSAEAEALTVIAQKADGGMRDALSIFDQVVSFTNGNVTYNAVIDNLNVLDYEYYFRLTDAILEQQVAQSLLLFDEILSKGFDGYHFISGLSSHFRDLLVCKDQSTLMLLEVGASIREKYKVQSQKCANQFLYKALEISNETELNYRLSKNKRLLVELALIRLCQLFGTQNETEKKKTINKISVEQHPHTTDLQTKPVETQVQIQKDTLVKPPPAPVQTPPKQEVPKVETPNTNLQTQTRVRTRPSTISLTKNDEEEDKKESQAKEVIRQVLDAAYTNEQFIAAWKAYAKQLPEERIIIRTTMEQCLPNRLSDNLLEVVVYNQQQIDELHAELTEIRPFIFNELNNNQFTINIREREVEENRKAYSKAEQFAMMAEKNPDLAKLKDMFGLEIE